MKGHSIATTALVVTASLAAAACGGGSSSGSSSGTPTILIGLNVPTTADPYVAGIITRGAQLAVDQENAAGGVKVGGATYTLSIKKYDDGNNPQQAASNVDTAIHDGAVALIEAGTGASISASHSASAGVPEIIVTNGDTSLLVNKQTNAPLPSLFRLGIPNDAASTLLSTYIKSHTSSVAILHDDTSNGRDGATTLESALGTAGVSVSPAPIEVPSASPAIDAQVQQVKAANPSGIVLWGTDLFIAKAVSAFRAAGVTATIYTSKEGASPAVRLLAGNAATEGIRLVTGRMTSEGDDTSFPNFEKQLAQDHLGPTDAGFKNAEGQEIRQPNDVDFFAYDSVKLIVAALQKDASVNPSQALLKQMAVVMVKSANGDARGFDPMVHEAFAAQDVYIAGIHDMQYEPVKDEMLSATLPAEDEILADFHA